MLLKQVIWKKNIISLVSFLKTDCFFQKQTYRANLKEVWELKSNKINKINETYLKVSLMQIRKSPDIF